VGWESILVGWESILKCAGYIAAACDAVPAGGGRDALEPTRPSVPTIRGIQAYAEFAPAAKTKSLK